MQRLINCITILFSVHCLLAFPLKISNEVTENKLRARDSRVEDIQRFSINFCAATSIEPQLMMNPSVEGVEEAVEKLAVSKTRSFNSSEFNELESLEEEDY
ncbi:MAG: hypothetical protein A3F67_00690 [Verrucomicrobia bacterium RIFCSPHIGHO2_12_FULL_41_10]|nr:MAG: hypothetical protein A3F67_00690 [Verrucomicrobia bacterium RIFCSPHIGHO2_12_FULL_41_10]HLB33879.1 hypothetical protein [Chthoniobacterales bacterium]